MEDISRSKIKNLTRVSPSRFTGLKACALREVWITNGLNPLLPASPKARVGIITHQLLTEAGRGHLLPDMPAIENKWFDYINQAECEMMASPIEKHLLPLERSVPDLQVRRIRAIRCALAIAQESHDQPCVTPIQKTLSMYGFELHVKSRDGLVRGLIDCAISQPDGPLIRDFKSGELFERDDNTHELKHEYQVQLKMYAETFGKWPIKLEIVPLYGALIDIPFNHKECTLLVREAKELLFRINSIICSNTDEQIMNILTHPNPSSCYFCQYRPTCRTYKTAIKVPETGWPIDIWGILQEVKELGNSKLFLRINTQDRVVNIPGLSPYNRHLALQSLKIGDTVAIFNLKHAKSNDSYNETPMTTIYKTANGQICETNSLTN